MTTGHFCRKIILAINRDWQEFFRKNFSILQLLEEPLEHFTVTIPKKNQNVQGDEPYQKR